MYADSKHQCHFYASSVLDSVCYSLEATDFFRKQLVTGVPGSQHAVSTFQPVECEALAAPKNKTEFWQGRLAWLQVAAAEIRERWPDRRFIWFVQGGVSSRIEMHQQAGVQLNNVFSCPGWTQHVSSVIDAAPGDNSQDARPTRDGSTTAGTSASAPAVSRTRQHRQTSASVGRNVSSKRKVQPGCIVERPGTV